MTHRSARKLHSLCVVGMLEHSCGALKYTKIHQAVRKTLVHPATVDECGTVVSSNLMLRAHRRNLEVGLNLNLCMLTHC